MSSRASPRYGCETVTDISSVGSDISGCCSLVIEMDGRSLTEEREDPSAAFEGTSIIGQNAKNNANASPFSWENPSLHTKQGVLSIGEVIMMSSHWIIDWGHYWYGVSISSRPVGYHHSSIEIAWLITMWKHILTSIRLLPPQNFLVWSVDVASWALMARHDKALWFDCWFDERSKRIIILYKNEK